jgi:hypothetical protein
VLPGETIDDAAVRVAELPEGEWRRLAYGSQLRHQTMRMLGEHLEELQELTQTIGDVEGFWSGLRPEEVDAEAVSLIEDQNRILEEMEQAIRSLQQKMPLLQQNTREKGSPG